MGGTKTQLEQLEARGGRDTFCFPASVASAEERHSQHQPSLTVPTPQAPSASTSPLELPGCWSHIFLSVPLTLALKAITISSLIYWFVFFSVALLLFNFLSSKFLGLPW